MEKREYFVGVKEMACESSTSSGLRKTQKAATRKGISFLATLLYTFPMNGPVSSSMECSYISEGFDKLVSSATLTMSKKELCKKAEKSGLCSVITVKDYDSQVTRYWLDSSFRLLQQGTQNHSCIRASREKALTFEKIYRPNNELSTRWYPVNPDDLTYMKVNIKCKEPVLSESLESNKYQTLHREGNKGYLELHSVRWPEAATGVYKRTNGKDIEKYLKPVDLIESDDPEIVQTSLSIRRECGSEAETVSALCQWVYDTLEKRKDVDGYRSAKETLKIKAGSCSEHAVLLCALCRAAGIPARFRNGLVFSGVSFGAHRWSEVYSEGVWIPVDATRNYVGVPACYIALSDDDPDKVFKLIHTSLVEIRALSLNEKIFDLDDPSAFLEEHDISCTHRLWGLTLAKPPGWKVRKIDPTILVLEKDRLNTITVMPLERIGSHYYDPLMKREIHHHRPDELDMVIGEFEEKESTDFRVIGAPLTGSHPGALSGTAYIFSNEYNFFLMLHHWGEAGKKTVI